MASWTSATAKASRNPGSPCLRLATEAQELDCLDQLEVIETHADSRSGVEFHIGRMLRTTLNQCGALVLARAVRQVELQFIHAFEFHFKAPLVPFSSKAISQPGPLITRQTSKVPWAPFEN